MAWSDAFRNSPYRTPHHAPFAVSFVLTMNRVNVVVMITILVLHASVIRRHVHNSTPGLNLGICFLRIWLKSPLTHIW